MTGHPVTPEHIQQIIIREATSSAVRASDNKTKEKKEDSTISIDDNSKSYLESLSRK
jgi:hypothetical protein